MRDSADGGRGFWSEIRRRGIVHVTGLYLVAAWLIVQVADTLAQGPLPMPPEALRHIWVAVAMICGFIGLGYIAARIARRGISPALTSAVCMGLFMAVQLLVLIAPPGWYLPVWMVFGFIGTAGIIAYAGLSQLFEVRLSGRVTTSVNMLVFVATFAAQWLIGIIIEMWPAGADGSYNEKGFYYGFGLMLVLQIGSLLWYVIGLRLLKSRERSQEKETLESNNE